ncbi:Hsp20 family protein [Clostridium nigeriense]|uniref:Hsp20 family protein n=1 Tax=Clostridium nigeriense TaxID=1805470 RepID=UPI003D335C82
MFEMFPFLFNNLMSNNPNGKIGNVNNINNNNLNGNVYSGSTDNGSYKYGTFTNGNDIINVVSGSFMGTFNGMFNDVFNSLINNESLINSIVDSVLSSDMVNSIIEGEEEEELKLEFRDYGDRYLIEGKIEGVNKQDIDIDYDNDHISIKISIDALRKSGLLLVMNKDRDYIEKSFYVPRVDAKRIQAVYNADVLRIYLKKLPEAEEGTKIIDVEDYTTESRNSIK